jgi:hypothetical protein
MAASSHKASAVIPAWVIANSLGAAAIGALSLIAPRLIFVRGMLPSCLIIGLPIGLAQWIALRRIAPISILWVLTVPAGLYLGLAVVTSPIPSGIWGHFDDESVPALTAGCMTIGLLIGLVQLPFLWRGFPKSLLWPLTTALALGMGLGLVLASDLVNHSGLASIIFVLLVYATATGFAISWMSLSRTKVESSLVNAA